MARPTVSSRTNEPNRVQLPVSITRKRFQALNGNEVSQTSTHPNYAHGKVRTAIKTFELQARSVHSKFEIARTGNEMSLHNNRFMVSPLAAQCETRTAGPGRIQGLSSPQSLYALLPSVDVSGKNYYHKRLKQTKTIGISALFSLRYVLSLQCNKDHIQALTQQQQSTRSEETSFKPVR
jgi:hypothetical protein